MMRFCQSCNNLLYPRENRERKSLEYACRPPCVYVERDIYESKVFVNELIKDSSTKLEVILSDVNKVRISFNLIEPVNFPPFNL
jgi:DNA-directed RNA polymerase II subunit RPB9